MTTFYALREKESLELLYKRNTKYNTMSAAKKGYERRLYMRSKGSPEHSFGDYLAAYDLVLVDLKVIDYSKYL